MNIKPIKETFNSFTLFIFFLYAFIPFETNNAFKTLAIHAMFLFLILSYALYIGNLHIKMNVVIRMFVVITAIFTALSLTMTTVYGTPEIIFVFSIIFAVIIASKIYYNKKFKRLFLIALKWLIIFSISMLFLQIIVLNLTGEVLKIHQLIYPFSEARVQDLGGKFDSLIRMGGAYIEPGTYSNWMYLILIIYIVLTKKLSNPLLYVGAISLIFSYSVWGMVFGSYMFIILMISKLKRSSVKVKIIIFTLFLLLGYFLMQYAINSPAVQFALYKVNSNNISLSSKELFYHIYNQNLESLLIIGKGFSSEIMNGVQSPQDAGIIGNISFIFGIPFALFIMILYIGAFLKSNAYIELLLSVPIFFTKIYFYDPLFWLYIFLVFYIGYTKKFNFETKKIHI